MSENSGFTTISRPQSAELAATVVRPVPPRHETAPGRNPHTASSVSAGPSSGSLAFAEETRRLLRSRLMVTHAAIGIVAGGVALLSLMDAAPIPAEAGIGPWVVGLSLIMFGQSLAGWLLLLRYPQASLVTLRRGEIIQFTTLALVGGMARFIALTTEPAASSDPRFHDVVYRFAAVLTSYPLFFAIILYGVLIPNTRRRSLTGVAILCAVPLLATGWAAVVNPHVRAEFVEILPTTAFPLFMASVIAVFSATQQVALQREAFEAHREAQQLGSYTLRKRLGEGGMGEVWLAEHRLLKRPCAIKFIRTDLAAHAATARRFEREVRAVTALTHFNTVRIFDYGQSDDGSFYYVMEYLEGPTLDKLVKDSGPLEPARAVYLLRQLCGALAEAHAAGMVHRDLKPSNVIITSLGGQRDVVKLLDFGLVQDHSTTASDDRLTQAGTVLGTPSYMCPEQAGGEPVDARGDIYCLGCVAFFMLCGRPPFEAASAGKLISQHLTQPAPSVHTFRADVPTDLADVIAKCLAKEPEDRYQTASELEVALLGCTCSGQWNAMVAAQWWQNRTAPVAPPRSGSTLIPSETLVRHESLQ
ncbi:MAG: serine/threonine-protein kinase [Gemmataceae bacterium]|nr:serine/threonine protein kinase [Gemmata sp.]MDW8198047.1 serine/threonine-protein kinase [Gemmataceae bacterium]